MENLRIFRRRNLIWEFKWQISGWTRLIWKHEEINTRIFGKKKIVKNPSHKHRVHYQWKISWGKIIQAILQAAFGQINSQKSLQRTKRYRLRRRLEREPRPKKNASMQIWETNRYPTQMILISKLSIENFILTHRKWIRY